MNQPYKILLALLIVFSIEAVRAETTEPTVPAAIPVNLVRPASDPNCQRLIEFSILSSKLEGINLFVSPNLMPHGNTLNEVQESTLAKADKVRADFERGAYAELLAEAKARGDYLPIKEYASKRAPMANLYADVRGGWKIAWVGIEDGDIRCNNTLANYGWTALSSVQTLHFASIEMELDCSYKNLRVKKAYTFNCNPDALLDQLEEQLRNKK